jgi:hypothetical protein
MNEYAVIPAMVLGVAMLCFGLRWLNVSPVRAAVLIGLLALADETLVEMPSLDVGVRFLPQDILGTLLALLGAARILTRSRWSFVHILLLGLFGGFVWHAIEGSLAFGVRDAFNEARGEFYFLSAMLYFSTFDYTQPVQKRLLWAMLGIAGAMVALAVVWWTALALNLNVPQAMAYRMSIKPMAVLKAGSAFFIGQVFLICLCMRIRGEESLGGRWLLLPLLGVVILLQHRSVWVTTALGTIWIFSRSGQRIPRLWLKMAVAAVLVISIGAMLLGEHLGEVGSVFRESLAESQRESSTWTGRVESWDSLLFHSYLETPEDWAFGKPYGTGYFRVVDRVKVEYAPHNYYVTLILRNGILGLACFLALYAALLWRSLRPQGRQLESSPYFGPEIFQAMLVSQLAFYVPYDPVMPVGILVGLMIQMTQPGAAETQEASASAGIVNPLRRAWGGLRHA